MAKSIVDVSSKSAFDYSVPRICKKCGVLFSGRGCSSCHNAARKIRRQNNPGKEKPYAEAYRIKHKERIAAAAVEYRKQNPDRIREIKKASRETHKERISLQEKAYRLKTRDIRLKKAVEYRLKTKAKKSLAAKRYRSENPDRVKAQFSAWVKANPESNRVRVQNRRARRIANGGEISKGLVDRLLVLQQGRCPCCGDLLGTDYHLDHITPLAKGGSNSDNNMQLLKRICNMQKHAKDPIDFMQERGFLL